MEGGGWWVALGGAVATILTAGGALLVNWMRERHRAKQEDLKAQADRHEVLIDRQEKQIARMQTMMDQLYDSNTVLRQEHAECQAEQESMWVWMQLFHRSAVSGVRVLRALGHEVDDIPPLPERRDDREKQAAVNEFRARGLEQNRKLVETLRPPPVVTQDPTLPAGQGVPQPPAEAEGPRGEAHPKT